MPDRRRFAVVVTPLLALLGVAAAILLPSGAAPAAAQSTEPAVVCFEITVGWRICAASSPEPPPPCQGVACIEPVTGAFVHRTYQPGERIGTDFHDLYGAGFFLDVETGVTESYRVQGSGLIRHALPDHRPLPTGWVTAHMWSNGRWDQQQLLRRETGQTWRWPTGALQLLDISSQHLLFEEREREEHRPRGLSTGRFLLLNAALEPVARFAVPPGRTASDIPHAFFSPDGQTLLLVVDTRVYRIPAAAPRPELLAVSHPPAGWEDVRATARARAWTGWYRTPTSPPRGPGILVEIRRSRWRSNDPEPDYESHTDTRYFPWDGAIVRGPACPGNLSPDGRYVAQLVGAPIRAHSHTPFPDPYTENPWPAVIVADASTCEPLFRVRSAHTWGLRTLWGATVWLSNSDGFVVAVADGYRIVHVGAEPKLIDLPHVPDGVAGSGSSPLARPVPAPTGDGRYFAYDLAGVYDRQDDRWILSGFPPGLGTGFSVPVWGSNHRELTYWFFEELFPWAEWLLLPPAIEFPPFRDAIAFRVARTGGCLPLRAAPGEEPEITDCLADGERLTLIEKNEPPYYEPHLHPSVSRTSNPGRDAPPSWWISVRTEEGTEGWVSIAYLDHDIARCQPRAPADATLQRRRGSGPAGLWPALDDPDLRRAHVTTGSVTDAGDYAFLTDPDDLTTIVTTYEGLRDGSTTGLVIHKNDGLGRVPADFLDLVEAGDIFEWREADDCFVRYTVTEVKDDPAGDPPRKLLALAWMTYAFTGCTGAISPTATASLQFGPLPDLGGTSLTAPIVHGMTQIVPEDWTGALMEPDLRGDPSGPPPYVATTDLATARTLPHWRAPRLPDGWTFERAEGGPGSLYASVFGYCAWYRYENGGRIETCGSYIRDALWPLQEASWGDGRSAAETRVVNGRPVILIYSPPGPHHSSTHSIIAWIYDPPTNTGYGLIGGGSLEGSNVDAVLEVLGSLFEPPNAP